MEPPFIFATFWPLMKFFQIIGCFPCYKSTIEDVVYLKPMNNLLVIALYCFTWIINGVIVTLAVSHQLITPRLIELKLSESVSLTDWLAQIILWITMFGLHIILLIISLKTKHKLCQLQDFLRSNLEIKVENRYVSIT